MYALPNLNSAISSSMQFRRLTNENDAGVPLFRLLIALSCPLIVAFFAYTFKLKLEKKILMSVFRTIVQLFFAGYVLLGFIFSMKNPFLVLAYLVLMTLIAALEATSRQIRTYEGHFYDSLLAIVCGGGVLGILCSMLVFNPNPWWHPQIVVPTVGMLIGNAISGPSIAVDRFLATVSEQKHELETRLSFGANSFEAAVPLVRASLLAALLPTLNQMSVVGIVSIPGMMTGQLLGGASPLVAAEYQMVILWLICSTSALSTFIALSCAIKHAALDENHRLTYSRIIKKSTGKTNIEVAIYRALLTCTTSILASCNSLFCYCCSCLKNKSSLSLSSQSGAYEKVSTEMSLTEDDDAFGGDDNDDVEGGGIGMVDSNVNLKQSKCTFRIIENANLAYQPSTTGTSNGSTHSSSSMITGTEAFVLFQAVDVNIEVGEGEVKAMKLFPGAGGGLSVALRYGERMSLEGPSGLGKTRLLRAFAQLDPMAAGGISLMGSGSSSSLRVDATPASAPSSSSWLGGIASMCSGGSSRGSSSSNSSIPEFRRRCIYVPQALPPMADTPMHFLREFLGYNSRRKDIGSSQALKDIESIADRMEVSLGLGKGKLSQEWTLLSGGERQRSIIGCALISAAVLSPKGPPVVLLLDEPTAACDAASCEAVERAIVNSGVAAIIVTHDDRQAVRLCHKRLMLAVNN